MRRVYPGLDRKASHYKIASHMDSTTRRLLEAPIVPTLLRLAAPNVVMLVAQVAISILEAYYVGWLGADALAGVSVTFPLVMLMQTMSAGGMGGGVASAVARALSAGRRADASRLVSHAIVIALAMSAAFTVVVLGAGRAIYSAMGARGGALDAALAYSNVIFAGAAAVWLFNTLASAVRGTGNMLLPAGIVLGGSPFLVTLSPALIFGWGPLPRLGVTGAALAVIAYYLAGVVVLFAYLASGRSLVRLVPTLRFERALFAQILRVGAPSLVNNVMTNLTVVLLTALVGPFGTFALAAAFFPHAWLGLFTDEPAVLAAGATYLRVVGPTYGFFGLGLALYFASQGAGRLLWPLLAGSLRLLSAAAGGWLILHQLPGELTALFAVMALALVLFGSTLAGAIRLGAWEAGGR